MKKRIILSMDTHEKFKQALQEIEEEGIEIIKQTYNTEFGRYGIVMNATLTQAYTALDLGKQIGAVLWKGES